MPRSGPGRVTGLPSSSTSPVVGVSSPATRRSKRRLAAAGRPEDGDEVVVGDRDGGRLERARRRAAAHAGKHARDVLDAELAHAHAGCHPSPGGGGWLQSEAGERVG